MRGLGVGELKAGVLLGYLHMGLQLIVGLLYMPIVLRMLGQEDFGLYTMVASVLSYLGLLSFGFGGAYLRFYSPLKVRDDSDSISRLNGMFLLVFLGMGSVAAGCGLLLSANMEWLLGPTFDSEQIEVARVLGLVLTINLFSSFPTTVFVSFIMAHERFIIQKVVGLVQTLFGPLVVILVLFSGRGVVGLVVTTTVVSVAGSLYLCVFAVSRLKMQFAFRGIRFPHLLDLVTFSGFLFLIMVVDQINWNVDKLVVGRIRGPAEVAVYGVAALLNTYYLNVAGVVSVVVSPRVNRLVAEGNRAESVFDVFVRVGRMQLAFLGLLLTGLLFFGRPFMALWAGDGYEDSYVILILLSASATLPLIQGIGVEIQKAQNQHKFRALLYAALAFCNVLLSIPLARAFGGVGAAAATALSMVVGNGIVMNWYYHRRVGLDVRRFWGSVLKLAPGFACPIVLGIVLVFWIKPEGLLDLLVFGGIYAAVYLFSMWVWGLNDQEKAMLTESWPLAR